MLQNVNLTKDACLFEKLNLCMRRKDLKGLKSLFHISLRGGIVWK